MMSNKYFKLIALTVAYCGLTVHATFASHRKGRCYQPPVTVNTHQNLPPVATSTPEPAKILTSTKETQQCFREDSSPDTINTHQNLPPVATSTPEPAKTQQCFREDSSPDSEKTACGAAPLPDNGLKLDQPTIQNFTQALKEQDPSFNEKEYDIVTDNIPQEQPSLLSWISAPLEIYNKHIANFWETHVAPFPDRVAIAIHSGVTTYRHFVITQISQDMFDTFLSKISKPEDRMIWIRSALHEAIDSNIESDVKTILKATDKDQHKDFGVSLHGKLKRFFTQRTQESARLSQEDYTMQLRSIRDNADYLALVTSNSSYKRPTSPDLEQIALSVTEQAVLAASSKTLTYRNQQ